MISARPPGEYGPSCVTCSTQPSWMLVRAPISIEWTSPRTTAVGQIDESSPIVTLPITTAADRRRRARRAWERRCGRFGWSCAVTRRVRSESCRARASGAAIGHRLKAPDRIFRRSARWHTRISARLHPGRTPRCLCQPPNSIRLRSPPFAPRTSNRRIRQVLDENRAQLAALLDAGATRWKTLVVPLEEMQHRLSRTWSPVGHMNGVVNSDELRAAYNACLPLLTAWHTDLAQNERLYRAYETIIAARGRRLTARPAQAARERIARLPARGRRVAGGAQAAVQGADGTARDAAVEVR